MTHDKHGKYTSPNIVFKVQPGLNCDKFRIFIEIIEMNMENKISIKILFHLEAMQPCDY